MANRGMDKTMSCNPVCDWVRVRLPLWVGDRAEQAERNGDEGDLNASDRLAVERHLGECTSCQRYRTTLDQALGALATAATQIPVDPQAPSLWPALEHRIANHDVRRSSRWLRAADRLTDPCFRAWGVLHGERVLRRAWTRDSLDEAIRGRNRRAFASKRMPGFIFGISAAASLLVAIVGIPSLYRQWVQAQSTIVANAAPSAEPEISPLPSENQTRENAKPDEAGDVVASANANTNPNALAQQTESARNVETPVAGLDGAAAAPKPGPTTPPRRLGYDLEHGTPMPPDAREPKPVY
jgi:hypothetical protein